ncbi:hypothetical protein MTO96_032882 [Rhipicephalus appendiculatus]
MFPGPFRAASKPGVFIAMLAIFDIYTKRKLVTENNTEYTIVPGTVGGYAVEVICYLSKDDKGKETVFFLHRLCDGEWNDYFEWPFTRKITLIVTNPRNSDKDIRLSMKDNSDGKCNKKPVPHDCNSAVFSEKINWQDLELNGFIVNNTLYVNIEFE